MLMRVHWAFAWCIGWSDHMRAVISSLMSSHPMHLLTCSVTDVLAISCSSSSDPHTRTHHISWWAAFDALSAMNECEWWWWWFRRRFQPQKQEFLHWGGNATAKKKKTVNCLPYHITLAFKDNSFYCKIKSKIYELGYPII